MTAELPVPSQEQQEDQVVHRHSSSRGFRILEISFLLLLAVIALVVEFMKMPQNKRAIPFQQLLVSNATTDTPLFARDLTYNWPYQDDESVSTVVLILLGIVLPMVCQFLFVAFVATALFPTTKRPLEYYNTFCSYLLVVSMSLLIIDTIKLYTGVLRPHFYDRCQPDASYQVCTTDSMDDDYDSRASFPSGHAGISMAGLGSLSLYIYRKLGVGRLHQSTSFQEEQLARLWSLFSLLPILLALYIGTSRIYDNYHQPADVVGGAAIGAVSAYFCHWIYFWDASLSRKEHIEEVVIDC